MLVLHNVKCVCVCVCVLLLLLLAQGDVCSHQQEGDGSDTALSVQQT